MASGNHFNYLQLKRLFNRASTFALPKETVQNIMSIPKRHHYLPIFYLEKFSKNNILSVFDRDLNEYRKQTPISTAVKKHYYTTEDNEGNKNVKIEEFLSQIEALQNHNELYIGGVTMEDIITKIQDNQILLKLDKSIYKKEAVLAASYKMTNLCFIVVKPLENNQLGVYFETKNGLSEDELKAIAKNYCNEVLGQQIRFDVEKQHGNIRDLLVKQAFSPIENIKDKIKI